MSYNGSGTFDINSSGQPVSANTLIEAAVFNAFAQDVATGLSTALTKDGQTTVAANLPMAGYRHTGVGNGVARSDYAAMGQVQDGKVNWVDGGGTADAITATYVPSLTALADGQLCFVRATAANATTTPTFSPNSLTARTIVKNGGDALVAGSISGDGHELILRYDLANTRWELLNPKIVVGVEVQAYDAELAAIAGLTSAANKVPRFTGSGTADLLDFKDEDNMASDSATAVPSQQSVKAYVDSSVTAGAKIVQVVEATPYTTYSTHTTQFVADDNIPQKTQGEEIITVSITPTNASNRLRIEFFAPLVHTTGNVNSAAALFQDDTAPALAATLITAPTTYFHTYTLVHEMAAGTTSDTTFKIRMGPCGAVTMAINGDGSARKFGGVCAVRLRVTEIKV